MYRNRQTVVCTVTYTSERECIGKFLMKPVGLLIKQIEQFLIILLYLLLLVLLLLSSNLNYLPQKVSLSRFTTYFKTHIK